MEAFIQGMLLAFGLILPLGPQNAFILSQGATQPRLWQAAPAVITAGICDTLLILLAVLGVSAVLLEVPTIKMAMVIVGVCFLLFIAWQLWKTPADNKNNAPRQRMSWQKQILFACSVSLLNPYAYLDTIGVIGTAAMSYHRHDRMLFTTGCILTSWLWFISMTVLGRIVGARENKGFIARHINHIAAMIMLFSAGYVVYLNV
ncbi:MAG: putative amino-acid transporter YisU [marine bacterium B5-7]|nr:MAG: putative amino-acid transporter YisU [marine bacterium B5-7]